ncbi:MAG: dienelactone hydrolase family protein [Alphaproteobacteria bacterium]|nr:dienelactone hydrolase family protein [Alphaproteobacteria bacterium]
MAEITIAAKTPSPQHGSSFMAYLATPPSGKGPGIVLIQEIFGVNQVMRDLADGYAKQGYVVACPDIFWRQQPRIQITDKSEAEWKQAFGLFQGFDFALGIEDLTATLDTLRRHPACTGKVGTVGYCLGGNLAFQMACKSSSDGSVGYYGVGIENLLGAASGIRKPLMLHIAEKDEYCKPDAQAKIKAGLAGNPQVTIHSYAGQDHAFARVGGAHYDKAAADLANGRTADFFRKTLG